MPLALDAHDDGRTVPVHRGATVVVTLASNASTGYSWKLVSSGRVVRLVSHRYVPPAKQLPGAGGREVWRFVVRTPGALLLTYVRPWLPKQVARRFRVLFRVT